MTNNECIPFFSIIIPTYNRAQHLVVAIKSLLQQDFDDVEVLIVDDGSTDNTETVVAQLCKSHSNLKYFYKQNEERSIARNFGIMKARGKYVGFLDSDDIVYSNHLQTAYRLLTTSNFPEVGHLGYQIIDLRGKVLLTRNNFNSLFKNELITENILHGNAIFIRNDIAHIVNFIPSKLAILSEDWFLWLRLASRYKFHFDNTITSAVVEHGGRSLKNIDPDKLIANTEVIVNNLKADRFFLSAYGAKADYHFSNHYTFLSLTLALNKNRKIDSLKYLFTAAKHDILVVFRRRFIATIKHLLLQYCRSVL
jgi:glycosyltransferase involved in cell wall biosynthesis